MHIHYSCIDLRKFKTAELFFFFFFSRRFKKKKKRQFIPHLSSPLTVAWKPVLPYLCCGCTSRHISFKATVSILTTLKFMTNNLFTFLSGRRLVSFKQWWNPNKDWGSTHPAPPITVNLNKDRIYVGYCQGALAFEQFYLHFHSFFNI